MRFPWARFFSGSYNTSTLLLLLVLYTTKVPNIIALYLSLSAVQQFLPRLYVDPSRLLRKRIRFLPYVVTDLNHDSDVVSAAVTAAVNADADELRTFFQRTELTLDGAEQEDINVVSAYSAEFFRAAAEENGTEYAHFADAEELLQALQRECDHVQRAPRADDVFPPTQELPTHKETTTARGEQTTIEEARSFDDFLGADRDRFVREQDFFYDSLVDVLML